MNAFTIPTFLSVLIGAHLVVYPAAAQREPHAGLKKYAGLTDAELRDMEQGKVIAKVLETHNENEVAVGGVVWIEAPVEEFVRRQKDIESFETGDAVLAIQRIHRPPRVEDFAKLTFPEEDLKALAKCKVGKCPVKVDAPGLARLQAAVDWSAPDAYRQANRVIRQIMLEGVENYLEGGDETLGAYRDKSRPLYINEEFDGLLASSPYIPSYDPELHDYLDDFPDVVSILDDADRSDAANLE